MGNNDQKKRYSAFQLNKQIVALLVVITILSAFLFLENQPAIVNPQPEAILSWDLYLSFKNTSNRSNTDADLKPIKGALPSVRRETAMETIAPINYLKTTLWGKQDVAAWKRIYGDTNCADNRKRKAINTIIKTWLELVHKYDINYTFVYGSLIGIVRNNDIIPWDHDVDVYVEYKDVLKLEKEGWPRDIRIRRNTTFVNYIPNSEHHKPVDERIRWDCQGQASPQSQDQCSIQEPLVRLYYDGAFLDVLDYRMKTDTVEMVSEGKLFTTKKRNYFPIRRCVFMGFSGWCPNDPQVMLSSYYGKHFLIPNKRCKNGRWVKRRRPTN